MAEAGDNTDPAASRVPSGVRAASDWSWRILVIAAVAGLVVYLVGVFSEIVIPLLVAILVSALLTPTINVMVSWHWPRWVAIIIALLVGLPNLEHVSVAA